MGAHDYLGGTNSRSKRQNSKITRAVQPIELRRETRPGSLAREVCQRVSARAEFDQG